jgi:hypothetical protein
LDSGEGLIQIESFIGTFANVCELWPSASFTTGHRPVSDPAQK